MTDRSPTLTHGCVRCGTQIPLEESMCELCNPLGLRAPAATQAHGTIFLAIGIAVVVLLVFARITIAGVGPFHARLADVATAPGGLSVTIAITNQGAAGATMCRVSDPKIPGIGPETAFVQSPRVGQGATVTFEATVTSLGTKARPLDVACGT